jgi:hypothetical protein
MCRSLKKCSRYRNNYQEIIKEALEKALHLYSDGVVFEFETLIKMIQTPAIAIELVQLMNELFEEYYQISFFERAVNLRDVYVGLGSDVTVF